MKRPLDMVLNTQPATSQQSIPSATTVAMDRDVRPSFRFVLLILFTILVTGISLRTYRLSERSLWFDEAFSWRLIEYPSVEMLQRSQRDNSPPLYYIILHGWVALFGESAFALRSLSVLFGGLTILGTYLFSVEAFGNSPAVAPQGDTPLRGRGIGLLAAALVAFSAIQVRYSWEIRMYALATALAVFSSWSLLRSLRQPSRLSGWLLYGSFALFLAYTHYYALFTLAAQAVFVVGFLLVRSGWNIAAIFRDKTFWHALLVANIVVIGWLPWLPTFLRQRSQVQKDYWTAPVNRWAVIRLGHQLFISPEQNDDIPPAIGDQLLVADACVLGLWFGAGRRMVCS